MKAEEWSENAIMRDRLGTSLVGPAGRSRIDSARLKSGPTATKLKSGPADPTESGLLQNKDGRRAALQCGQCCTAALRPFT